MEPIHKEVLKSIIAIGLGAILVGTINGTLAGIIFFLMFSWLDMLSMLLNNSKSVFEVIIP